MARILHLLEYVKIINAILLTSLVLVCPKVSTLEYMAKVREQLTKKNPKVAKNVKKARATILAQLTKKMTKNGKPSVTPLILFPKGKRLDFSCEQLLSREEYLNSITDPRDLNLRDRDERRRIRNSRAASEAFEFLEDHPQVKSIANYINEVFQSPEAIADIAEELLYRGCLSVINSKEEWDKSVVIRACEEMGSSEFYEMPVTQFGSNHIMPALFAMIQPYGWKGTIELTFEDDFLQDSIQQRLIPLDVEFSDSPHSMHAHALQIALASRAIAKRFGANAVMPFFKSISKGKGIAIWNILFDRDPDFHRDFRGPVLFKDRKIAEFLHLS